MAIFNTARLRDILVGGQIAEAEPATEFVQELEEQMSEALSEYATQDRLSLEIGRVLRAIAEADARAAEREARIVKLIMQAVGILLAGTALAVGIILGFG